MTQTKSKTNWVAIVLLIIVLFATAFGALCYFDDGFKEKIFGKPDSAAGKELVSTTIVNETYGTFELSANSMCLNMAEISNDLLYANGTDFNYLIEEYVDLTNLVQPSDTPLVKEDFFVGIKSNFELSSKFLNTSVTVYRDTYLRITGNKLIFYPDVEPIDLKYISSGVKILSLDKSGVHDRDSVNDIVCNVYVQLYEYTIPEEAGLAIDYVFKAPILVISDKGVPLTEKIYKEMLDDSTTQITKHYKE